jgi:hypothetical protein
MLFGDRAKPSREQIAAVKRWAAELLPVEPEASLMVTELACYEQGCPPVETVIAALAAGVEPRQWKLHKPIAEVTREDVQALADGATNHDDLDCHAELRGWRCPD